MSIHSIGLSIWKHQINAEVNERNVLIKFYDNTKRDVQVIMPVPYMTTSAIRWLWPQPTHSIRTTLESQVDLNGDLIANPMLHFAAREYEPFRILQEWVHFQDFASVSNADDIAKEAQMPYLSTMDSPDLDLVTRAILFAAKWQISGLEEALFQVLSTFACSLSEHSTSAPYNTLDSVQALFKEPHNLFKAIDRAYGACNEAGDHVDRIRPLIQDALRTIMADRVEYLAPSQEFKLLRKTKPRLMRDFLQLLDPKNPTTSDRLSVDDRAATLQAKISCTGCGGVFEEASRTLRLLTQDGIPAELRCTACDLMSNFHFQGRSCRAIGVPIYSWIER